MVGLVYQQAVVITRPLSRVPGKEVATEVNVAVEGRCIRCAQLFSQVVDLEFLALCNSDSGRIFTHLTALSARLTA